MRRVRRSLIVLVAVIASPVLIVDAGGFHNYSQASVSSLGANAYIGVRQTRINRLITNPGNTSCTQPYSGSPVYQTQWNTENNAQDWVEIGTGHQCYNAGPGGNTTYRYHFWGQGVAGSWFSLGVENIGTAQNTYAFVVSRSNTPDGLKYLWTIGGVLKKSLAKSSAYDDARVGLESYKSGATVAAYNGSGLQYLRASNNTWTNWSTPHSQLVNPEMCGLWNSDTSRRMGQNTTC